MNPTQNIILQTSGSYEVRSMLGLAMKRDIRVTRSSTLSLRRNLELFECGAVPIGSVEFVRQAMTVLNIKAPPPLSYPEVLRQYLRRDIDCIALYDVERLGVEVFVKPAGSVKLFDGFIYSDQPAEDPSEEEFRQQQREVLVQLPAETPVFVCPIVHFQSEWRVYVHKHRIVGQARYDDGADDASPPSERLIREMVREYKRSESAPIAYSLDVGVLGNGKTALVEVNDAWALGLYRDMEDHDAYLALLADRWAQITKIPTRRK